MIEDFWLGVWAGITASFVILVVCAVLASTRKGK